MIIVFHLISFDIILFDIISFHSLSPLIFSIFILSPFYPTPLCAILNMKTSKNDKKVRTHFLKKWIAQKNSEIKSSQKSPKRI